MSTEGLIDRRFIASTLVGGDRWSTSHGTNLESDFLGAGMIYYALAYSMRARTCMCLGSGGGFVPRTMRQAQRDLGLEPSRTILVDGADKVGGERKSVWGSPAWVAPDSPFRRAYPEIELVLDLTEHAYTQRFAPEGLQVDFLHIDADHHYDGVKRDWELYRNLVSDWGVITLHDTINYREPCGVPALLAEIREDADYEVVNFPVAYGTAVVRRKTDGRTPPDALIAGRRPAASG